MKNYFQIISYFTSIILLVSSCSEDDVENPIQKTNCTVSSLSSLSSGDTGNGITFKYLSDVSIAYNSENRITSVKEDYLEEENCPGATCVSDEWKDETRLTYNENKISTIAFFRNGIVSDNVKAEVTYEGDQLKTYKLSELSDGVVTYIDEYRFIYENENVTKIEIWETESINDPLVLGQYTEFTYQGNNIVNSKWFGSDGVLGFETTATYDEKVNPLYSHVAMYISEIVFNETYDLMFIFSENNPVSIEYKDKDLIAPDESKATIIYQYNEFDVPTSYSYTETGGSSSDFTSTITNDCK